MAADGDTERDLGSFVGGVTDSIKQNLAIDIKGMKQAGAECHSAARETSTICTTTTSKAGQLVAFGLEMKSALDGFSDGIDTHDFAAIGNVLASDKMRGALSLASEMDDLAIECTKQSVKMIDTIDTGIETLPDILEKNLDKRMENAKQKGSKEGDPDIPNLEEDVRSLQDVTRGVQGANLLNAIDSFQNAFEGISTKGKLCEEMFTTMREFADDVAGVSEAIENFKLGKMVGHIRDLVKSIWRCLRLSDLIRAFAKAVEQLISWIIKVIQALIEKIQSVDMSTISNCGCCTQLENTLKSLGFTTSDLTKLGKQLLNALAKPSSGNSGGGTGMAAH
mmetsp:Transcript_10475/g.22747  ORF Transcript_10475/g.22747 Transcript_10475/m.22747 type:complete len:336 (+) Transcript_10475:140-1147(+)